MTLYDLFSPLISYIVSSRYDAAQGKAPDEGVLISHIMREFDRIRKTGATSQELRAGLDDACRYTAFYIDYMVHEGKFPYAQRWQDLGRSQYNELAGDEKFFDYMRGWLEEGSPLARAHLRLMYEMVASGFSGALGRRSVRLEELMRRSAEQLAIMPESEATQTLLRQRTNTGRYPVRPRHPVLTGLSIAGLGSAALLCSGLYYLHTYQNTTDDLHIILERTREDIENKAIRHALNSDSLVASHSEQKNTGSTTSHSGSPKPDTPLPPPATSADIKATVPTEIADQAAAAIAPLSPSETSVPPADSDTPSPTGDTQAPSDAPTPSTTPS